MTDHPADPLAGFSGFEWDEAKRSRNVLKHGIDFPDALAVFTDPSAMVIRSPVSSEEVRYLIVGRAAQRMITVIFTRRGDLIRLISARVARRTERKRYDPASR